MNNGYNNNNPRRRPDNRNQNRGGQKNTPQNQPRRNTGSPSPRQNPAERRLTDRERAERKRLYLDRNALAESRRREARNEHAKQLSRARAVMEEQRRIKRRTRRARFKAAFERAIAVGSFSIIGLMISLGIIVLCIRHDFTKVSKDSGYPIGIKVDEHDTEILDDSAYSYRYGEHYVSLSALSKKLGFSILGDVKKMTMHISDDQNCVFSVGSTGVCVNGTNVTLDNPTYFSQGQLFVPCSFFTSYCNGITSKVLRKNGGRRLELSSPETLTFVCSKTTATPAVSKAESSNDTPISTAPGFISDLSSYEQYMNPENRDEFLTLINTSHPLDMNYVPDDLTDVINTRNDRQKQQMRLYAAKALEAMFKEMYASGFGDVTVTSGYRSYAYQKKLFDNEVNKNRGKQGIDPEKAAAQAVAIPGTSEHQSGLSADLHNLSAASVAFASEDAYKWLISHCADFGFILRFPKDKTDVTGIMFEPWHYRFVGRYHAQKIMNSGLCLEEYIEQYKPAVN